jgi:acyl-coenzyme A synthetase/AMP-(fatty) acid ligase
MAADLLPSSAYVMLCEASSSQSITYAELGKRSAAISHFLMSKGIRAGDTGVILPSGEDESIGAYAAPALKIPTIVMIVWTDLSMHLGTLRKLH